MTTTEKCADGREHLYLCSTCGKHGPEDADVERLTGERDEERGKREGFYNKTVTLKAELKQAGTTAQQATGLLDLVTGLAEHLAENRHLKPVEKRVLKSASTFLEEKP